MSKMSGLYLGTKKTNKYNKIERNGGGERSSQSPRVASQSLVRIMPQPLMQQLVSNCHFILHFGRAIALRFQCLAF